ncbi:MAG: lactate racemase domain-containing protein [Planctomycetota bacterium]|jgi:hypothetical protein|nr:lactate racemase domain-containing protein [Planctomycetota bacterium]
MNLPRFFKIKQDFASDTSVADVDAEARSEVKASGAAERIQPGARIAVTGGSRGIANLPDILRSVGAALKDLGAEPFVNTAMGSHGGGTAEGQLKVLKELNVTEETVGMPVRSTMETRQVGETGDGMPVYLDELVCECDGVFVVNRVKKHTDFHGAIESGLCKMMALGLGKVKQADLIHANQVSGFPHALESLAQCLIGTGKIVGGLAIIENRLGNTAVLHGVRADEIPDREKEILKESYEFFPRLPFDEAELVLVQQMGKNISGGGMDPNVLGRLYIEGEAEPENPNLQLVGVLELTKETEGNASGIGFADFISQRLLDAYDRHKTVFNTLTSNFVRRGKIPITLENDTQLIQTALTCIQGPHRSNPRMAFIRDTLHLEELIVTESLLESLHSGVEVLGETALEFNSDGNLNGI